MTKKDYLLIAAKIRCAAEAKLGPNVDVRSYMGGVRQTANAVADGLYADNVRFDRERFLAACGVL